MEPIDIPKDDQRLPRRSTDKLSGPNVDLQDLARHERPDREPIDVDFQLGDVGFRLENGGPRHVTVVVPRSRFTEGQLRLGLLESRAGVGIGLAFFDHVLLGDHLFGEDLLGPPQRIGSRDPSGLRFIDSGHQRRNRFPPGLRLEANQFTSGLRHRRLPHLQLAAQIPVVEAEQRRPPLDPVANLHEHLNDDPGSRGTDGDVLRLRLNDPGTGEGRGERAPRWHGRRGRRALHSTGAPDKPAGERRQRHSHQGERNLRRQIGAAPGALEAVVDRCGWGRIRGGGRRIVHGCLPTCGAGVHQSLPFCGPRSTRSDHPPSSRSGRHRDRPAGRG